MSPHSPPEEAPSWFIIKVTVLASLGGCLFGYDLGSISGALPQLTNSFDLSDSQQEWVVSILYLGGGLGASVGGTVCDFFGRQRSILGTDVVFIFGAAWLYWANSYAGVLVGRFVVGIAVAVSGIADVAYLHEIAPPEWRGSIVSVNEACISLGFLLAYIAGYVFSSAEDEEWRLIFGLAGVLALIQGIGMWKMPESPVWLAEQGRLEESRNAWKRINSGGRSSSTSTDDDEHHMGALTASTPSTSTGVDNPAIPTSQPQIHDGDQSLSSYHAAKIPKRDDFHCFESLEQLSAEESSSNSKWTAKVRGTFRSMLMTFRKYRRQSYIALFLAITQQFCGQTNVLTYAPHIFAQAAGKANPPGWSTLAIGGVKFVVTVLVIWRIEYVGRRKLLLLGMTCISLGMFALIVAFGGSGSDDPDSWSTNLKTFNLALPGVLLVVCGYSISFGPLTWLLTSELFPTEIRGRALGASTIITYLCASLVTRTFLSASSAFGPAKVFGIYCIVTTVGIVFAYLAIPDTGEKTVEQIEDALRHMWWWRYDSILLMQIEEDENNDTRIPVPPTATGTPSRRLSTSDRSNTMQDRQGIELQSKTNMDSSNGRSSTSHLPEIA
jgi:MFS family permease